MIIQNYVHIIEYNEEISIEGYPIPIPFNLLPTIQLLAAIIPDLVYQKKSLTVMFVMKQFGVVLARSSLSSDRSFHSFSFSGSSRSMSRSWNGGRKRLLSMKTLNLYRLYRRLLPGRIFLQYGIVTAVTVTGFWPSTYMHACGTVFDASCMDEWRRSPTMYPLYEPYCRR
jgi:hypothetical protein